jgi:hypothetical protein
MKTKLKISLRIKRAMEDFKTSTKSSLENNTTEVIVEFPESGKICSTIIKNRAYPDETNALINGTIYKLVYHAYIECIQETIKHMQETVKAQVREKLEQKNIEVVNCAGRPKSKESKHNLTEEQKQYEREKALRHYYKKKQIGVCA